MTEASPASVARLTAAIGEALTWADSTAALCSPGPVGPLSPPVERSRTERCRDVQAEDRRSVTETEVRGIPMRVFSKAPATMRDLWALAAFHRQDLHRLRRRASIDLCRDRRPGRALAHLLRNESTASPPAIESRSTGTTRVGGELLGP
ncbi:MAG: hypothetical protein R2710_01020 [Acidimicrobiales bacterium]